MRSNLNRLFPIISLRDHLHVINSHHTPRLANQEAFDVYVSQSLKYIRNRIWGHQDLKRKYMITYILQGS